MPKPTWLTSGTYTLQALLWRVKPIFEPTNRTFASPATMPSEYRAPSFSWASIDVVDVYAQITDHNLSINVECAKVDVRDKKNPMDWLYRP
jgi:hypothetical protein